MLPPPSRDDAPTADAPTADADDDARDAGAPLVLVSARAGGACTHRLAGSTYAYAAAPTGNAGDDADGPALRLRRRRTRDVLRQAAGRRVLVLVHGFNTPFALAQRHVATFVRRLEQAVPNAYDLVVGFTWPGGAAGTHYLRARRRAEAVAPHLRWWLARLAGRSRTVDVLTHSLGSYVARRALRPPARFGVRHVFAVAPAVPLSRLRRDADAHRPHRPYDRLYLFFSPEDGVLGHWFPVVEWDRAVGHAGPDDDALRAAMARYHVTAVRCAGLGHLGYLTADAFYGFLARVLRPDAPADPPAEDKPDARVLDLRPPTDDDTSDDHTSDAAAPARRPET
jgi:hypothetical protein